MRTLITVILFLFLTFSAFAQRSEVGLFGGASYYNGDLNPGTPFNLSHQPSYGLYYRYNFDSRLAIKIGYTKGELQDSKIFTEATDGAPATSTTLAIPASSISFKTPISELSAQFEVNFYDFSIDGDENRVSPYIFGGVGFLNYNGTVTYNNFNSLPTSIYPKDGANIIKKNIALSFPFGIGVKYCPFPNVTTGLEWGMRKTTSDKLDGVYTDPYRVSAANDWYSFVGFSISFRINFSSDRCDFYK